MDEQENESKVDITKLQLEDFRSLAVQEKAPPSQLDEKAIIDQATVKEYIPDNIKSIVISNYKVQFQNKTVYYILHISRNIIELNEKNETLKTKTKLDLKTKEIFLNEKQMSPVYYRALQKRIQVIFNDCKNNKAIIYEEKN